MFRRILAQKPAVAQARIAQMASHLSSNSAAGASLRELPKSNVFTSSLPPDPAYPTPQSSHEAPREKLGPRLVKDALFTYVRPASVEDPELLAVSPAAMRDIGIKSGDERTDDFKATVSGNSISTWNEEKQEGIYPWAQCYGGYQFGNWASQLGDGRAISLFEVTNPETQHRFELQLKGAGRTPYSRFADGKAVLRSSIREFVVSEALNALRIPTTRALALTYLPHEKIRRERVEPGAIVARFAESWIRLGTFDLLRSRGYRQITRQLSDYVVEKVFSGWESLPARIAVEDLTDTSPEALAPGHGVAKDTLEGPDAIQENRYTRFYREVVRRNAETVAKWQAYAFTNGVLNTDNTSIYGLSIDFGPFAFLDNFDPSYTPNHDDAMLRYSYRNQPTIIWWNLVRLGEDLAELIGAGPRVDDAAFVEKGVAEDWQDELITRAETIIERAGHEYKAVFLAEYKRLMASRLGLKQLTDADFDKLLSQWLDLLQKYELDFNHSFRRLSSITPSDIESDDQRKRIATRFFHQEGISAVGESEDGAKAAIATWLEQWRTRVLEDWGAGPDPDQQRCQAMKNVNPKFIPRSWILDELITRVEKQGEREILQRVLNMALNPFAEEWGGDREEEERFCGDVPRYNRAMQCSCSS